MRHTCLGISKSKMSRHRASEKALLAMGIPAGGVKGDQDLDNGQAQGQGSSSLVVLDSDQSEEGRGGVRHTLPTSSFHRDASRTSPDPGG